MSSSRTSRPTLYSAGAMRWRNDEDSTWRRSIDVEVENATFLHPDTDSRFDHGGDLVDACVSEDMALIGRADGLIAYITQPSQVGTLTEVLHAVSMGMPVLVMYHYNTAGEPYSGEHSKEVPHRIGTMSFRGGSDDYWFLINYLAGDTSTGGQRSVPDHIPKWRGKANVEQYSVDTDDIPPVVERWVQKTFDVDVDVMEVDE